MSDIQSIRKAALAMSHEERAELADTLLASLNDEESAKIEEAWIEECERRWDAIKRGEIGTVDGDVILRKLERGEKP
jgi:putative addiction module component (TIGR02574 family)